MNAYFRPVARKTAIDLLQPRQSAGHGPLLSVIGIMVPAIIFGVGDCAAMSVDRDAL